MPSDREARIAKLRAERAAIKARHRAELVPIDRELRPLEALERHKAWRDRKTQKTV